jgi:integrase
MIVKLTPDFITNHLHCPAGKRRIEYVDKGGTGLYVEVRATSPGQGTYYLRYKDANGKTCHEKIGRTDIDLEEARQRAKRLKAEITLGNDPRAEQNAKKATPTLEDFFRDQYLPHCKVHNRGHRKKEQMFDLRVKNAFGTMRLDQIKRHDITAWHVGLREDGLSPAYADRFLALLRHILAKAVEFDMLSNNPASGIKMFNPDNRVEHYLEPDELERLLTVLRTGTKRNFMVRMVALFLLSTGARLNEALSARWQDIDRDHRVWRIPASNSKSKKVRSVPLNDSAIEVLDQLGTEDKHEWLFVNVAKGERLKHVHGAWHRLRAKAGLHLRIHDLRHQYASFLVNSGRTLYEVQQILGHSDPVVTQRYAHLSSKSLQDAANSASDAIKGATVESR